MTATVDTFDRLPGDHATYVFGDAAGAVALARVAGVVAADIETAGLGADARTIKAVSIGTPNHAVVLDPAVHRAAIRDTLREASVIVMHNSPFDAPLMVDAGLMTHSDVDKIYDTIVTARLASPDERSRRDLATACDRHLHGGYGPLKTSLEDAWRAQTRKSKSEMFRELGLASPLYRAYSAFDIIMTARLYAALPAAVVKLFGDHPFKTNGDAHHVVEREQTVNRVLLARSCRGLLVDFEAIDELRREMGEVVATYDAELARWGVDTGVGRELVKIEVMRVLDEHGALPSDWKRLQNGKPTADKRYLERLEGHPLVEALTARSTAQRFVDDYARSVITLAHEGRIHPQVAVCQARTGRMSYGSPPLQQFPPQVRRMIAFDRPVSSLDWKSVEPVFLAYATNERGILDAYEAGGDVYQPAAEAAGVDRDTAKVIVLAGMYGQGRDALAARLGRERAEVEEVRKAVFGHLSNMRTVMRRITNIGNLHGRIQTLSGRILPLDPDPRTGNHQYFGYRGVNHYVQGSCYDLLSEAIAEIDRQGLADAVQIAMHDELVCDSDAADDVARIMATPPPALVALAGCDPVLRVDRADLGHAWKPKK